MDPEEEREKAESLLSQQLRSHFNSKTITEYLESYSNKPITKIDLNGSQANRSTNGKTASNSTFMSPTSKQSENLSSLSLNAPPSKSPSLSPTPTLEKRDRDAMREEEGETSVDNPPRMIKKLGRGARKKELILRHDVSYISQLNEVTQAMGWPSPRFEHACVGTAHAQLFKVQCHVNGLEFHAEKSTSKLQAGKEDASLQALKYLFKEQS